MQAMKPEKRLGVPAGAAAILYVSETFPAMPVYDAMEEPLASGRCFQVMAIEADHKVELGLEPFEGPSVSLPENDVLAKSVQTARRIGSQVLEQRRRIRTRPERLFIRIAVETPVHLSIHVPPQHRQVFRRKASAGMNVKLAALLQVQGSQCFRRRDGVSRRARRAAASSGSESTPRQETGGLRSIHGRARSKAADAARTVSSPPFLPTM